MSATPDGSWLTASPIAHRGLHDDNVDVAENSLPAFELAIERRWTIELDVRLLGDGTPVVFHDATLLRLCGIDRPLRRMARSDLDEVSLPDGTRIPTLAAALQAVAGAVPVIVECKPQGRRSEALASAVHDTLASVAGPTAVLSFDPRIVSWFARREPGRLRGLNAGALPATVDRLVLGRGRQGQPHFTGFPVAALPSALSTRLRGRGVPVLAYTVRTGAEQVIAEQHADGMFVELWNTVDPVRI